MRTNNRITLNEILQHKEHFDQRLLEITETLNSKVTTLTSSNAKLTSSNQSYKKKNFDMRIKMKDLESQKYTLNKKYMEVKKEKDEAIYPASKKKRRLPAKS